MIRDEETINSVKKRSLRLAIPNMARTNNFHGISIVLAENENIIKQVRDKINAKIESGKAGAVENVMIPTEKMAEALSSSCIIMVYGSSTTLQRIRTNPECGYRFH